MTRAQKGSLLLLAAIAAYWIVTVTLGRETWRAFVYPDRGDLLEHRDLGEFDSLEECRDASLAYLSEMGASQIGDYECGLNCRSDASIGLMVCEETLR